MFSFVFFLAAIMVQVPDTRSDHDLWIAALAILTVIATAIINGLPAHLNEWVKRAVCGIISLLFAVGGSYYSKALDTDNWGRTWLLVFLGATAIYVLIYKPGSQKVSEMLGRT